jgi:hypothetical protein
LAAFCEDSSIEFLYPLEAYKSAARRRTLYFERDGHPNAYGHALAARIILQTLKTRYGIEYRIAQGDMDFFGEL